MTPEQLEAEGWQRLPTHAFSASIGPTLFSGEPGKRTICLLADANAVNENLGIVHGGALLTFADIAMGFAVADELGGSHFVTAQLQFQFTAAAQAGTMVTCSPEIVRTTSQLVFARALMHCGDRVVASTDAIFKVLDTAKMTRLKAG
ncbi:MAG: PaaI family thioesterase [Novosphingobium sp.]|nr:PaaI family thioesterase [Novosphingobium sp.]